MGCKVVGGLAISWHVSIKIWWSFMEGNGPSLQSQIGSESKHRIRPSCTIAVSAQASRVVKSPLIWALINGAADRKMGALQAIV